jgi:hypothetical protein
MPDRETKDLPLALHNLPRRHHHTLWALVGLLLFALAAAWSVATPLMASPDEPSHVVKAAAVARGQWSGTLGPKPTGASGPGTATIVRLPTDLAASIALPDCYAFHPEKAANCAPRLPARASGTVSVQTFAGQYPPLYYLLVGWPSLLLSGEAGLYAMRLASAAISAAMFTWGAFRLSTVSGNRLALWGAVVAITPMCLFLAGTVNPSGLEISAAFSFWAACLVIVSRHGLLGTGTLLQAAVSGAVLVNIRASSPFWALAIVLVAMVAAPPGRLHQLVRHRLAPWLGSVALLASVPAVGWILTHGRVASSRNLYTQFANPKVTLLRIQGRGLEYLQNMIGNFGWLDTPAPPLTYVLWYVAAGALVLLGLTAAMRARSKTGLGLLVGGVAAVPFIFQFPTAAGASLIWQGRYALPVAVGVPLLAALLLGEQRPHVVESHLRVFRGTLPVVVAAHIAAFYWASRRYSDGVDGHVITFAPQWSSPIGFLTGTALYAVLCTALAVIVWRRSGPIPARSEDDPPLAERPVAVGSR